MFSFAHEKTMIHIEIRNNVRDAGYFFVSRDKQSGLWSQDKDKEASGKIRNAFRHLLNPRQRIKEEEEDDAIGPLTEDGRPTSKSILPGTHNRKANAFFRACIMTRMQEYEAQTTEQQREIRNEVKMAIAEAGYFFLERDKETNAWSQLTEKYVGKKIRTTFAFLLNAKKVGKPKVEEEEGVATEVADVGMKKHMVLVDNKEENDVEHENKQEDEVLAQIVRDKQNILVNNTVIVEIDSEESNIKNTVRVEIDLEEGNVENEKRKEKDDQEADWDEDQTCVRK